MLPFFSSYKANFESHSFYQSTRGNNTVAFIPGRQLPNKFILLSAHFDHLGRRGRTIYYGADDNASGTSALLYYAKKL